MPQPKTPDPASARFPGRHRKGARPQRDPNRQHRVGLAASNGNDRDAGPRALPPSQNRGKDGRITRTRFVVVASVIIVALAAVLISRVAGKDGSGKPAGPVARSRATAPLPPRTYLGVYIPGVPGSYAAVSGFAASTGVSPGIVVYYSGWPQPFQARFAATVAAHGAVPLVQMDPTGASLAAIAAGKYDAYLRSFAGAVKAHRGPVILSFGHEMNGPWYSWGYRHTSPRVFVATWRHIVTLFRAAGARNVTWLWTVNIIRRGYIPSPARWWPGGSYVNWVGIDGYYYKPSWKFASLFGPTIKAVHSFSLAPVLIAETGAARAAGKPAKIADLFAGIRAYGLRGFVWFDAKRKRDWRLDSPAAKAAFRRGAQALIRSAS